MKSKIIYFIFFISGLCSVNAQDSNEDKRPEIKEYEFKEISKAELQQKYHPKDSVAPAAIIYEKGDVDFDYIRGWKYNLEVTRRIKIYSKEGYEYANIKIPYFSPSSSDYKEKVTKVKARTYNLKDGKVVDERVRRRDVIDEERSENTNIVKFTFPKVEPGSVIEYTYTLTSPNIARLNDWEFQHEIPTDQSVYELSVPERFGYSERSNGYQKVYKKESSHIQDIKVIAEGSGVAGSTDYVFNDFTYYAFDLPKMKDEPFVNNQRNFLTTIKHELAYLKNIETGRIENLTRSWKDVVKNFYKSDNFGKELDRTGYYEDNIDQLLAEHKKDGAKIFAIFDHVRSRVKWNEDSRLYCSDRLKDIYEDGKGNSADINLMLTSMLRYAGFNANPILVSTISHGVPNTYPARTHYNYVISGVELGNGKVLKLDATSRFTKPDQLPYRCLNWNGRIIRRNGTSRTIALNPSKPSKINYNLNLQLSEDGTLSGKVRKQFTEQIAYFYRVKLTNTDEQEYIDEMGNEQDIQISDFNKRNVKKIGKPVLESFSFTKENGFDKINDKIYLTPLSFLATDENPFKQGRDDREFPINFTYPRSKKIMANIVIPEGYKIDYLPERKALKLPESSGSFSYNVQQSPNGNVQIMVQQNINKPIFLPEFYPILKQYFDKVVEKETDKIVLTKT